MKLKHLTTSLAATGSAFILYIGLSYLVAPQSMAPGFGVSSWPQHDGKAFLTVKGVRYCASGLVILALLLNGQRRALGWALAASAVVPPGTC
ncbi:hypothetical protein KCMC57_up04420 [Kitasatospora sp. CMC57]|uniref:Uncharacterized protein n=1 Tax=Kitasatospora sp. CMC57 TaxID=3231513 RepID=A0AB33JXJ2_9ACTN